jgi:hypothetical protein
MSADAKKRVKRIFAYYNLYARKTQTRRAGTARCNFKLKPDFDTIIFYAIRSVICRFKTADKKMKQG